MFRFNRTLSERRFHASSNLYCLTEYSSLAEIPKKPVTGVFGTENGRIKVKISRHLLSQSAILKLNPNVDSNTRVSQCLALAASVSVVQSS